MVLMLQGWIFYAQSEFREVPEKLQYLRSVNELALTCLEYHVEDAMELVAEVLENYPKFFESKHQEMLWSAIAGPWGLEIIKNSDAETVSLARIIVAYGQNLLDSKDLYKFPSLSHNQQVLCKQSFSLSLDILCTRPDRLLLTYIRSIST
tara:strand:+ start:3027 stop:3476 length:450 start_codon:yes stop_codon:yes gene_type:complete